MAALGAITPLLAHAVGGRCWIYLPAHVPPLLGGLAFGPVVGLIVGAAAALSDLLWGGRVHGLAFLPLGLEFVTYGLVAGIASGRRGYGDQLGALLLAMLAGRLVHLAAAVALGRSIVPVLTGLFAAPWPGMLLQVLVLPPVALVAARLLPPEAPSCFVAPIRR